MMRLVWMSIATLMGLLLLMQAAPESETAHAGTAQPPLAGIAQTGAAQLTRLAQANTTATDASPVPVTAEVEAPKPEPMPGPTLRRSPEYAHRAETPDAAAEQPEGLPEGALIVDANSLNLRAGPSTSDSVVGKLSRGDVVKPLGAVASGWVEIQVVETGKHGFTAVKFLKKP